MTKRRTLKLALMLCVLFDLYIGGHNGGLLPLATAQSALTQTTTSAAVAASDAIVNVTSATGITAAGSLNQPTVILVIDKEAMDVVSVSGTVVTVKRAQYGSKAVGHASGAVVSISAPSNFLQQDPNGACTSGNLPVTPQISLASGRGWACDSQTGVWVQTFEPAPLMFADHGFFIGEANCTGATTGTAGAGNATDILTGSGGTRVYRVGATAASSSANTFTCNFSLPVYRTTANKGCLLTDITFLVSAQTTIPTSITLPTLKTFNIPAAAATETANSATFVAAGGTLSILPTSANFAALAAVAAGQFYSIKTTLGTPVFVNTDLQQFQYVIVFNQSASAISIQETPGLIAHCTEYPF